MKEIEKIIQAYQEVDWSKEKAALGTVVKVEGSAYRRIGARMFVRSNGIWVGGISGGCLEGDALRQAQKAIQKNESSIVVYDTTEDDPHQIGVGLGCNGRIEVLFTPIDGNDATNQIEFLKTITDKRDSNILLQVLAINKGDLSLRENFYTKDKFDVLAAAMEVPVEKLKDEVNIAYRRRKSKVFMINNAAGHTYEILAELIRPKIKLVCVGDNYDVNAMLEVATVLGWEIHVVGKMRKLNKAIHHFSHKIFAYEEASKLTIDEYTAVILMSHDYNTDLKILKEFIHKELPYLGLLGPKKRMEKMQKELGIDLQKLTHIHGPVGIDIGAESPEEIALSMASEIIAVFRNRAGGFLKDRKESIYDRI